MAEAWHHRTTLVPHPRGAEAVARDISVDLRLADGILALDYMLTAPAGAVRLPDPQPSARADGLWQTTCCELFLKAGGLDYFELNLSPSAQWAAYRFTDYRAGMAAAELASSPLIATTQMGDQIQISVQIDLAFLPADFADADWHMGLSCVVEGADGAKAYWALNHPPEKPDFHHKHCFALSVRAAERA